MWRYLSVSYSGSLEHTELWTHRRGIGGVMKTCANAEGEIILKFNCLTNCVK